MKVSVDQVREAAKRAVSVRDVMRILKMSISGSSHKRIKDTLNNYGIDTSHFLGKAWPRLCDKGQCKRLTPEQTFSKSSSKAHQLRRALISIGRKYECECGIGPFWNGKRLKLQVDHTDGNRSNNCPENLRFLCPNCHSQTSSSTYSKKGCDGL